MTQSDRNVVVYTRVSTDRQDLARQGAQHGHAKRLFPGVEVVTVEDDGVSAFRVSIFERAGGARLIAMIEAGEVEAVLADAQDRLSRGKQSEWWQFIDLCEVTNTRIFIDGREIRPWEDEGDELKSALDAMIARRESRHRSHRTKGGLREAARQGRYPVGSPPYGYRSVGTKRERRFLVEPAEAAVVRRVFEEYVAGVGVNRIASRLNGDGIRTRQGADFSARSILAVLPNRTYLGEICLKGETLATGAHEPIIDPEVFAQAERLRAAKKSRPNGGAGRPAKRHLLDGLLYCPNGHRMLARRWGHSEYYACSRKHTYGDCDAPDANRRRVDETLLHHFLIRHFDEAEMRERLAVAADEKIAEARALAGQADREEQEAVAALARIKRDYVAGKIGADDWNELRADLDEAQAASRNKAAQLRARAEEIQAEAAQVDVEAQLVARLAAVMRAVAGNAENPEAIAELRAALTATFERIIFQPVWADAPDGAPIVLGDAELAPVLRSDLLATRSADSAAKAPSPPGTRDQRVRRSRRPAAGPGDALPPRRDGRRVRPGHA
jgi:site-specific DNA recombinase